MESQKSQSKLTRTHSSMLRSSPTVRSSIHSLSSIAEISDFDNPSNVNSANNGDLVKPLTQNHQEIEVDEEEDSKKRRFVSVSRRHGSARFTPVLTMVSLTVFTMFSVSFLCFYFYFRSDEIATSENLLLALIFIAVNLFFASKNKNIINQNLSVLKHVWEESALTKRFIRYPSAKPTKLKPVQWFIGEQTNKSPLPKTEDTKITLEGVEFYSNGDYYEGEFHKGKCNGSGVYNFFVNGRYEGDWVDGRYDGYGIESWAKGSKYRGQYRLGLRHGFGVYRFYTGDSYAGEWSNGQSHGFGVQTCSDGSCFVGEFKFGVKHGLGVYHFRNGDRYAGEYFGDKIHGFGVYHFANGHCYEGAWHEGKKQGSGMYTFRSGDVKCGEWDMGTLKSPISPPNDAVLRVVHAARRTAQNAVYLRRVDEEVSKAVQSANRAATAARVAAVKAVQNRMDGRFCDFH